jgi:hypothetical protein
VQVGVLDDLSLRKSVVLLFHARFRQPLPALDTLCVAASFECFEIQNTLI